MLAYYYPPENESGALRPARFSKYLPRYGYQPVVIAARLSGNTREPLPGVFRVPGADSANQPQGRITAVARALQRVLPYNDRVEWVPEVIATASRILRQLGASAVYSTSPPIATHMAALWLKRRFHLPWIADFRDPLVGNPFRNRLHGRPYDALVERCIVSQADAVIVNTDAALTALERRYPKLGNKFELIWNGYDAEDEFQASPIPIRSYKVIAHVGSLYGGRHPGQLVNSLARLHKRGLLAPAECRLRLIGSIDLDLPWIADPAFTSLVEQGCIEYSNEVVPRPQARDEMAAADFLLILDVNDQGSGLQVPAKIFEYVRIGRPILAFTSRMSAVERILGWSGIRHRCVYSDDTDDEIDRKVGEFLSLPSEPVTADSRFQSQFDARVQTEFLANLISSLIKNRIAVP